MRENFFAQLKALLEKHDLWSNTGLWNGNKRVFHNESTKQDVEQELEIEKYFSWANDEMIVMYYEGRLNYIMNEYVENKRFMRSFNALCKKYKCYFQPYESWNGYFVFEN